MTNRNGYIVARTDHQAFGETIGAGVGARNTTQGYLPAQNMRPGYGMTENDSGSGQQHTWFRKLETQAGRWSSPDPYKGSMSLGDPQSFNRYAYVTNDPVNFIDPSGLCSVITRSDGSQTLGPDCWLNIYSQGGAINGSGVVGTGDLFNYGVATKCFGESCGGSGRTPRNSEKNPCGNGTPSEFGVRNDAAGGAGTGMNRTGGTFRVTAGATGRNGNLYSPKHYTSNWQGGSRARITTYSMSGVGRTVARGTTVVSVGLGGYDVYSAYTEEGRLGQNTAVAAGRSAGGIGGALVGAKVGAGAGALVGSVVPGVGTAAGGIIGGIIGGIAGGLAGSKAGEAAVCAAQGR